MTVHQAVVHLEASSVDQSLCGMCSLDMAALRLAMAPGDADP